MASDSALQRKARERSIVEWVRRSIESLHILSVSLVYDLGKTLSRRCFEVLAKRNRLAVFLVRKK